MSFRVAVACEDHTVDQYILKPLLEGALRWAGRPHARVRMITSPRIQGISDLRRELCSILKPWLFQADALVVVVDRDCDPQRQAAWTQLIDACDIDANRVHLLVPEQEAEIYCLWGVRRDLPGSWDDVRDECHPKEVYLEPRLSRADLARPDRGRKRLIESSLASGFESIASGCNELRDLMQFFRAAR